MTQRLLLPIFLFIFGITVAQKKAITHNDYDLWKSISDTKVSNNGKIIVSTITTRTGRGDGYIQIYNTETEEKVTYFNGIGSSITYDEKFVIFKKKVEYTTTRSEKKEETKKEDQEKEVLYIHDVQNNKIHDSVIRIKSYTLPKKNSEYLVIEKIKNKKDSIKGDSLPAWKNNYGIVYNLKTKHQDTVFNIKDFVVPEEGNAFYYTTNNKKRKKKAKGVFVYNTATNSTEIIDTLLYDYKKLSVNKLGNQLSFVAERDSAKTDSIPLKLYLYKNKKLQVLVENEIKHFGANQTLSEKKAPFFSENGKRLYFYSKIKSEFKKDTTLLDEEIPQVDVWGWNDKVTQPRQKANADFYEEDTRLRYFDIEKERYVQLQDETLYYIYLASDYATKYVLGISDKPYEIENAWNRPIRNDYYVINSETGKKRLLLKGAGSSVFMAKNGEYAMYFDIDVKDWFSVNLETLQKNNLTKNINVSFEDEDDDHPMLKYAHGNGGFDKNGNLLLYDKYDIWKVPLDGKRKPKNITRKGRRNKISFRTKSLGEKRLLATYIDGKLLLSGFNEKTKATGIYLLDDSGKLTQKIKDDSYLVLALKKALESDVVTFTKQNFKTFEDLQVTTDNFKTHTQITDANPQEKDFKWGTSELVSWKAYDGTKLEGIIHKPENFDPSKKYPMIVYFYERSADGLHNHYSPQPSASTVNKAYLVSNDYIVFTPDIVYKEGQPGKDAYNCVISGVEAIEKKGYVDSSRMALQGQSWGGYQVAYLVTKTNKFKAAMAGAPVSNMTSAYGGIRWGSGLSRMFQYEKTQSRIGKNLWEGFDLYVESSPLFSLPNVETPLLIMHNDNDGAVPYYQGIELYMGMRRLRKPSWLLVYNNEAHNLRKMKNKQDLSIRMMQFFDHYLKDVPAPIWMTKGVLRSQKGTNFGYELDKG
ncbi:MAG: alpha/beta hydrolase family protein [Kordia sp.]|uniref:alpha/beta hydrolase family protein n=1 Tax=Kordia sp. TaxID=1965332 RepID=UPI00385C000E